MEPLPPDATAETLAAQLQEANERADVLYDTIRALAFAVRQACQLASTAELTDHQGMLLDVYLQQAKDSESLLPDDTPVQGEETTQEQRERYAGQHTARRSRREEDKLARMGGVDSDWSA